MGQRLAPSLEIAFMSKVEAPETDHKADLAYAHYLNEEEAGEVESRPVKKTKRSKKLKKSRGKIKHERDSKSLAAVNPYGIASTMSDTREFL
ncbi:hypothetical protein KIN20_017469 [Parelaphostrongylus tenuis]|uniref:Uncharacterized protein n=1 Tax=Parelaphostrongylus tenuis TaxID=148309 RepID=A0AAD5QNN7_PARTN|nr:hypothetical protein KIN20_017469 [Parelaphostrongylus tenuis]